MRFRALIVLAVVGVCATALLVSSAATSAAPETGTYIVQMIQDPAVSYDGGVAGIPATKPGKGKKIDPTSPNVARYVDFLRGEHGKSLAKVGGGDRKSTRLNSSHSELSRMPSSA